MVAYRRGRVLATPQILRYHIADGLMLCLSTKHAYKKRLKNTTAQNKAVTISRRNWPMPATRLVW